MKMNWKREIFLTLICFFILLFFIYNQFTGLLRIIEGEKTAVSIEAQIVDIKQEFDTDGGYDYKMYVSYEFGGKKYENVYIGLTTDKDLKTEKSKKINDIITVEISSKNPELILTGEQSKDRYLVRLMFFGIILVLLLIFSIIDIRKKATAGNLSKSVIRGQNESKTTET